MNETGRTASGARSRIAGTAATVALLLCAQPAADAKGPDAGGPPGLQQAPGQLKKAAGGAPAQAAPAAPTQAAPAAPPAQAPAAAPPVKPKSAPPGQMRKTAGSAPPGQMRKTAGAA